MKLQVDTNAKTIKIEGQVQFKDLIKTLKKLLPKEWMDYSLDGSSITYWYNPITWYPYQPWVWPSDPIVTYHTGTPPRQLEGTSSVTTANSIYNIEVMN
jgi:hypothetical protein